MKTIPNTLSYPENAVRITDIYGEKPVTIPDGWEFVRFGPLKEGDYWLDRVGLRVLSGDLYFLAGEIRVIVRKAPKKLDDPKLWMWLFTSRGESSKCITAVDIYGSMLDGEWNEEDIEDFRPPVKSEKYIDIWGKVVRAPENYGYLYPRFILKP